MGGPGQRAADQSGGDHPLRIELPECAGCKDGAGGNPDEGVDAVPDRVEARHLVGEEFRDGQYAGQRNHPPGFEGVQAGRQVQPSGACQGARREDCEIEAESAGPGQARGQRGGFQHETPRRFRRPRGRACCADAGSVVRACAGGPGMRAAGDAGPVRKKRQAPGGTLGERRGRSLTSFGCRRASVSLACRDAANVTRGPRRKSKQSSAYRGCAGTAVLRYGPSGARGHDIAFPSLSLEGDRLRFRIGCGWQRRV